MFTLRLWSCGLWSGTPPAHQDVRDGASSLFSSLALLLEGAADGDDTVLRTHRPHVAVTIPAGQNLLLTQSAVTALLRFHGGSAVGLGSGCTFVMFDSCAGEIPVELKVVRVARWWVFLDVVWNFFRGTGA